MTRAEWNAAQADKGLVMVIRGEHGEYVYCVDPECEEHFEFWEESYHPLNIHLPPHVRMNAKACSNRR